MVIGSGFMPVIYDIRQLVTLSRAVPSAWAHRSPGTGVFRNLASSRAVRCLSGYPDDSRARQSAPMGKAQRRSLIRNLNCPE